MIKSNKIENKDENDNGDKDKDLPPENLIKRKKGRPRKIEIFKEEHIPKKKYIFIIMIMIRF